MFDILKIEVFWSFFARVCNHVMAKKRLIGQPTWNVCFLWWIVLRKVENTKITTRWLKERFSLIKCRSDQSQRDFADTLISGFTCIYLFEENLSHCMYFEIYR